MKSINISFKTNESTASIKEFVDIVNKFDCDFDLLSGRYIIDAKSIMGIFSLDLNSKIELKIHSDDDGIISAVEEALNNYIVA